MKRYCDSVPLMAVIFTVELLAMAGIASPARAQLSTGKPPAESLPPHGYVLASKPLKGTDTPADYTICNPCPMWTRMVE